jgi:hypothetical protein
MLTSLVKLNVYMAIIDMVGNHSYLFGSSNNTDKVVEGFPFCVPPPWGFSVEVNDV